MQEIVLYTIKNAGRPPSNHGKAKTEKSANPRKHYSFHSAFLGTPKALLHVAGSKPQTRHSPPRDR